MSQVGLFKNQKERRNLGQFEENTNLLPIVSQCNFEGDSWKETRETKLVREDNIYLIYMFLNWMRRWFPEKIRNKWMLLPYDLITKSFCSIFKDLSI